MEHFNYSTNKINTLSLLKKINKKLFCFFLLIVVSSCVSLKDKTKNSVFSVNPIQADQDYYTDAVLEYYFLNLVLKKFATESVIDNGGFQKRSMQLAAWHKEDKKEFLKCNYIIPEKLEQLNSGFQYRYYLFSAQSSAALQAFGITDVDLNRDTKYLVIDYIQYKDIKCPDIPTIRYAVGLRSELKITSLKDSIELSGKGGLAKLAAQVELGRAEVNFSLKTIGLSGLPARMNIPQGVSFNVTTYKDFQNSIQFLKTNLEEKQNNSELQIHPELIPVMDKYRPNTKSSIDALANKIILIHEEIEKIKKDRKLSDTLKEQIVKLYKEEISTVINLRKSLNDININVYSLSQYSDVLKNAEVLKIKKQEDLNNERKNQVLRDTTKTLFNDFFPGYPNLNKRNPGLLRRLEEIYLNTNSISLYDFNRLLSIMNRENINDLELKNIIELLEDPKASKKDLIIELANEIDNGG